MQFNQQPSALKQPAGLPVLFSAELWERFGFYCVQSLLVLYLTQKLLWTDKSAYDLFSAFSALIYATPIIGGILADKIIGYRYAVIIGAILYIFGYFAMGSSNPHVFNFALAALITGNGFFKPNVSSLLGKLYNDNDPRRESGFTWFYMGINLGSFSGPLICAAIAANISFHLAFMTAGVGMIISLIICLIGFKKLGGKGLPPIKSTMFSKVVFCLLLLASVYLLGTLLSHDKWVSNILIILEGFAFLFILGYSLFEKDKQQRHRLIALIILMIFSVLFWALYVQMFSSFTLFTERNLDRNFFGHIIPTGMFVSVEPFFIIVFAPLFAMLWMKLNKLQSRFNPSVSIKFALALISVGCAFLSLCVGIKWVGIIHLVPMGYMIWGYFLLTVGELLLSPIGLSAVTALAPPKLTGMVMGVWFLSLSAAYAIGGKLADLTSMPKGLTLPHETGPVYFTNFLHFGSITVLIGIVLLCISTFLNKMMK
jgi:POT family proton-dependent oligopeptide transporter